MKEKHISLPLRQDIPVVEADPNLGLTTQEAGLRLEGGWRN